MSRQYICGALYWAPPGPRNTEYGNDGWKSTYGKPGERDRIAGADQAPQPLHVRLRGDVAALVLGLGVDHQAVGAVVDGLGAEIGLPDRRWSPYTYCQAQTFRPPACSACTSAGVN